MSEGWGTNICKWVTESFLAEKDLFGVLSGCRLVA